MWRRTADKNEWEKRGGEVREQGRGEKDLRKRASTVRLVREGPCTLTSMAVAAVTDGGKKFDYSSLPLSLYYNNYILYISVCRTSFLFRS